VKKILSSSFIFPLIIIVLSVIICFLNYTPHTFLTGWDTLHPELNFFLNFKRLLNIWHSEQGLGTIPAHAQMSDLPRVFILYLFHFFLPLSFLRYSYIFLCFITGPLGIYFLIKFLFKNHKPAFINLISFLTALLYIFNLSTVQQFYVPLEMFPTQWALLPLLILFSLKYLNSKKTNYLLIYSLLTLFAAPQAFAPQLWYAFFIIYLSFLTIHYLLNRQHLKKSLTLIFLTLFINAFWLIPNLFYIFTSASIPQQNRDNRLFSQEYLLKNRQNGVLSDTTLIKGFYLDWSVFNFSSNTFNDLMPQWQQHLNNPVVLFVGYTVFLFSLFGLILVFIKKDKLFISLSPFFIIPFVLLCNRAPPFSYLFDFLIKNSTIKESFRFIFTKLSILLLFGLIIFFAYFVRFLFDKIKTVIFIPVFSIVTVILLLIYGFPMFQGYLISPAVRTNIPIEYFQFWQFMDQQESGRSLVLPLNQSSGWQYYNWQYQGSGFLWFNLKQSLFDRDSDRWSIQNEQSYKEFFNSFYSQDSLQFFQSLKKYQVKYLIWDQNIISSSDINNDQITFKYEMEKLINQLQSQNLIKLINQSGSIYTYQTNISTAIQEIKTINNFVSPSYQYGYFDYAAPDYITSDQTTVYYPFRDLLSSNQKLDLTKIYLKPISNNQYQISLKTNSLQSKIPSIFSTEKIIPVSVYIEPKNKNYQVSFEFPFPQEVLSPITQHFNLDTKISQIKINDTTFRLYTPPTQKKYLGFVNIFVSSQNYLNDQPIDFKFNDAQTTYLKEIQFSSQSLNFPLSKTFDNLNTTETYSIDLGQLPQSFGYIIGFNSQFISGIPLRLCLQNEYSLVCSLEDELNKNKQFGWDYFLVPSTGNDIGYQLNISNISHGSQISKSLLDKVVVIPIPFQLLSHIQSQTTTNISSNYLIFNQAYHKNWSAFYFAGPVPIFLKNHVLANNWANAWQLPTDFLTSEKLISDIYIIFWPQIFEYLGIILTISTLIFVFKHKTPHSQ
jgi:hypothetical protein